MVVTIGSASHYSPEWSTDVAAMQPLQVSGDRFSAPASSGFRPVAQSLADGRGSRVVHLAAAAEAAGELAERGDRVFHRSTASAASRPAAKAVADRLLATATQDRARSRDARLMAANLDAAPVASTSPAASAVRAQAKPSALMRLASLESRPLEPATNSAIAAYAPSSGVPRPSFRSSIAAEIRAETADASPDTPAILPGARPLSPSPEPTRVASLEPQALPGDEGSASDPIAALEAPLPQERPDHQPPSQAAAQPSSQPSAQPAAPAPAQPSRALAYARPEAPQDNSGGGSFFGRLFNRPSARLPAPGSGIAVYDIENATVYLPGDSRLEAHSGLGQMQDNPRYVKQKNRGPTPPNIYNLVMRERRFHGAEAIRLLPADGRKKFNRDGLLAHPYMYIGGGSRSQSNGCVVFKNYGRFLQAFKQGRINRLIVVPSLDELPTYMAAL